MKTDGVECSCPEGESYTCDICGTKWAKVKKINKGFLNELREKAIGDLEECLQTKDKYLKAWIQETGLLPSESLIEEQRLESGRVTFTIKRRKKKR